MTKKTRLIIINLHFLGFLLSSKNRSKHYRCNRTIMIAFIDDFYNDNLFSQNKIKSMLNSMPNLQEDYHHFISYFKDLERNENLQMELDELKGSRNQHI